jgi:tRNA threonylcarbamoyladenosine biosynthesis protein TsaB
LKILSVDSTSSAASCAVCEDGRIIASSYLNVGLTHSQTLLPLIDTTLRSAGLAAGDIDLFAAAAGPGSFTGVRIGVSIVKGLAFTAGKPCAGVSAMEAMAYSLLTAGEAQGGAVICPVMDARGGRLYNALFACGGELPERLTEDRVIQTDALRAELLSLNKPVVFMGDGAELCVSAMGDVLHCTAARENVSRDIAYGIACIALRLHTEGKSVDAGDLVPVYLSPSQAERELLSKKEKESPQKL